MSNINPKFNIKTSKSSYIASFVSNTGDGLIIITANNSNLTSSNIVYVGSSLIDKEAYISLDNQKLARFSQSNLILQGDLLPSSNIYNIGNTTSRYNDIFLQNKLHIDDGILQYSSPDTIQFANNNNELINITAKQVKLQSPLSTDYSIIQTSPAGSITLSHYTEANELIKSLEIGQGTTSVIEEGSNLYFTYERAGLISQSSNLDTSNYIASLSADQIAQGANNKFIVNAIIPYDLRVDATLTASNLNVIGNTTTINTNSYTTENLEIISQAPDGSALKVVQNGYRNIAEFYSNQDPVITFTTTGSVGIGITEPTDKLHIIGNLKLSGNINNITSNEIAYLSGITSPVQQQIDATNLAVITSSNNLIMYTNTTSNNLITYTNATSNNLITYTNTASNNLITYTDITNQTTSNNLITYANTSDLATSNNLISYTNTTANNLMTYANATSNNLITYANATNLTTSNNLISYANTTSNNLITYANATNLTTSNNLISYANTTSNNLITYANTTNLTTSNNLITYANATSNNLIIYANTTNLTTSNNLISYTNTTANNLITYANATSNNLITYANTTNLTTSNNLISYANTTSNNLITYANTTTLTTSNNLINYANTTSNNLINYANTTSNNLITYANTTNLTTSNNLINYTNTTSNNVVSLINAKEPTISVLPVLKGGTSISTITANKLLGSGASDNTIQEIGIGSGLALLSGILTGTNYYWSLSGTHISNNNTGNVGIGITAPVNKLHIHSTSTAQDIRVVLTDATTGATATDGFHIIKNASSVCYLWNYENTDMVFSTNNIERMRILANGYVGIGNTNPIINFSVGETNVNHTIGRAIINVNNQHNADKRDVFSIGRWDGTNAANEFLGMKCIVTTGAVAGESFDNQGFIVFNTWGNNISGSREVVRITQRGYIGIGITNPVSALHVVGAITATGNVTAYYSDTRLKTKIDDIKDPLAIIDNLKGFYYKANTTANEYGYTSTKTEIGLSAQDVQKVVPEIVSLAPFDTSNISPDPANPELVSKSGHNYLTVSYERLAPVFVESIKSLNAEIKNIQESLQDIDFIELKKEIEELKALKQEMQELITQNCNITKI